ncbi:hypothetical protein BB560_000003 [Smittium megazygosporum]|uniref:Transmembrane protein 198 n=1 Tax=Smittium megazygosporum TaxID=133381 RepID=A0A2T9ZLN9_9FUNG|nr:hypothetical protein BB560_000003 [Smittium megazygosporum]
MNFLLSFFFLLLSATGVMGFDFKTSNISIDQDGINASGIVAGIILIGIGLVISFLGTKVVKALVFCTGVLLGWMVTMIVLYKIRAPTDTENTRILIYVIGSVVVGIIFGVLAIIFFKVGVFFVGAASGLALGAFILTWSGEGIFHQEWLRIVFLVIFAVIGGVLIVFLEKPIIIIGSSILGAYITFIGIDCFARTGYKDIVANIFRGVTVDIGRDAKVYAMLGGTIAFALVSMFVQFRLSRPRTQNKP